MESWETLDFKACCNFLVFGGIDLSNVLRGVPGGQGLGSFGVLWGEALAVAAKSRVIG